MNNKHLLIIGLVWPEPTSSAAGWRMLQLIGMFRELNYTITFCSSAQKSERSYALQSIGVNEVPVALNDSSFDVFIRDLNPDLVMFDRFITEEQFGWRIAEQLPHALRILDGEDLHGLRKARELAFKEGLDLDVRHLQNDVTKRELVAMYRSDLTLVISEAEMKLLTEDFGFPKTALLYLPFVIDESELNGRTASPLFEERTHFITVGNFRHGPNADAINYLKTAIWPRIRTSLPNAELHVYGAYQSQKAMQFNNKKEGFLIKGAVPDIYEVMTGYRVCLAPLRYGAGLKGKLFDAMRTGTPSVMTSIAAEGLFGGMEPSGFITEDPQNFAAKAIELYTTKDIWKNCQVNGFKALKQRFTRQPFLMALHKRLHTLQEDLITHRYKHFTGQLFLQQSLMASRYLSKWIEAKNG